MPPIDEDLQLASVARVRPRLWRPRLAWVAMYWLRFNLDVHEPYLADMWHDAGLDPAAAGRHLPRLRPLPGPVALCEHRRSAAHRAGRRARGAAGAAGARDAAVAGGRPAQRADPLSDRAHLPDGGQPLRVPHLEGAPPLQPARGAGRAGAHHRRRRGRRPARQGSRAKPAVARRRAARRRSGEAGARPAQRQRAGTDRRTAARGARSTACAR